MVNHRGRTFFRGTSELPAVAYLVFEPGSRHAVISAEATEVALDDSRCTRTIWERVRALNRVYFPSRCVNLSYRPRSVIVACGDGNFGLRRMRWRGWNRRVVRGRGTGLLNDCSPFCAEGHFHPLPVRVLLSGRGRCPNADRYVYTRLRYRFTRRPSWNPQLRRGGRVPFPCRLLDA
jgi:hypothetical protein